MKKNVMKALLSMLIMLIFLTLFATIALAAETGMPWEGRFGKNS